MIQYLSYWLWLAVSVLIYWRLPERWRAPFLAAICIGFLTAYVPKTVALMLPICLGVYVMTNLRFLSERRSFAVRGSVALLLFYLAWFKYLPVIGQAINEMMTVYAADVTPGYASAATILIPLGISYFTFKLIHYAIERTRGTLPAHGPADYLSYVFLVPIFTAGPIERFEHYLSNRENRWANRFAIEGLTRIGHGLIKKFVIGALIFALIQNITQGSGSAWLLDNLQEVNPLRVLAFLALTYLYIYMDFAGYTDIALGCSRLFGLRIMENFNMPFLAPNIGNVWKRWHMSLAHWCQTYVYMPMIGITRNPYFAVLVSCTAMGLWHAASLSWLCWGLYNGIGVMILQKFSSLALRRRWKFVKTPTWKLARYPITFFFFSCSFAFAATATTGGVWGGVRLLAKLAGVTLPG